MKIMQTIYCKVSVMKITSVSVVYKYHVDFIVWIRMFRWVLLSNKKYAEEYNSMARSYNITHRS